MDHDEGDFNVWESGAPLQIFIEMNLCEQSLRVLAVGVIALCVDDGDDAEAHADLEVLDLQGPS